MDYHKRSRVNDDDAVADRLGELPDCLLHNVLFRLGSRQAVQTSILSRRWRHLWRDVPCVDINEREFANKAWARFEDFIDHMLPPSPPPLAPNLDAFHLHLSSGTYRCRYAVSDRWIRRCLRRSPAVVTIQTPDNRVARWITPPQPSTLHRLTTLRLVRVGVPAYDFLERLGDLCPILVELHLEECSCRCRVPGGSLRRITSPTLIRLAVIQPRDHIVPAYLIRTAPRLTSLRLDLTYKPISHAGPDSPPPLPSVTEASIRIAGAGYDNLLDNHYARKSKFAFQSSMRRLLARLPNAATLHLSGFTATTLLHDPYQEFPTLQSLRVLLLEDCDVGANFHALTSFLRNTPSLEKLRLHHCTLVGVVPVWKQRHGAAGALRCDKLESVVMSNRRDDGNHLLDLLSELSNVMPPEQWQRIRKSTELVV